MTRSTLRNSISFLSVEARVRYRSKTFEDVIDPGFDNYRLGAFDAELSLACKLGKETRLTLGLGNLLNVPLREYSGTRDRMNLSDRAGVDFTLGVQWKLPAVSCVIRQNVERSLIPNVV